MATTRILTTAIAAGMLLAAAGLPAHAADDTAAGGTIAFVSDRTGNDELYIMNSTGTEVRQLTTSPGFDRAPGWSPDGDKLVFNSRREPHADRPQIYTLDVATGEQVRVTESPLEEQRATWSGDGRSVFFHRGAFLSQPYNLIEHNLTTGDERQLTDSTDPAIWNAAPAPHPDGGALLFQSNRDAPAAIFPQRLQLLDLDTLSVTPIDLPSSLPATTSVDGPRWNADGSAFTFAADGRLFVADASGALPTWTATAVTDGSRDDSAPAFSPDGTKLVFQTYIEGEDPDGEDDRVVISTIDLSSGEITEIGEGRTPVWTAIEWFPSAEPSSPQPPAALAETGFDVPGLAVPLGLLLVGGIAVALSALVGRRRSRSPR
ncbi:Tol biopolymer transport system component [Microbacteriaceae bacterium SG_E_30_P1]|uniref:Tol biopolymer transport system component n=1 Tax=Antiquaquibacter oligotrophicus TaxID=2880260 RepID=A0ABT6KKJ7_9MICO|nr:hypothetical protein [Antiquaquibacter oligotrophicus]MDH6180235.1 Tol biopolymer transport system component [Antiquaquibacter oligotrophicus]UDF14018.1 hypothetical protein LH407_03940 [Antiquaquibacter oligotrophicus]